MQVKVTQSCPTLSNPMDYTIHGILQARMLDWVVFPFPFFRDLPNSGIEPRAPTLQADSLPAEPPRETLGKRSTETTQEPLEIIQVRAGGGLGENCNGGCGWKCFRDRGDDSFMDGIQRC